MRTVRHVAPVAIAALVLGATACSDSTAPSEVPNGVASCQGSAFLTVSPVDVSVIRNIVPLGNLSPPGHTLPTDHLYIFGNLSASPLGQIAVRTPGEVVISEVTRQTRLNGPPSIPDFTVTFFPCADVKLYFAHVIATSEFLALVGPLGACNQSIASGGFTYESCTKRVNIKLTAGSVIGTMGGDNGNVIDFGGYDRRSTPLPFVNPARSYGHSTSFGQNRTICPIDYFDAAVANELRGRIGRVIEPTCGTIMQDVPNTAQGRWYFNETVQDDAHLALAHDNLDPRTAVLSVGTSIPSLPTRYWSFIPAISGRVNADFSRVIVDGQPFCYEGLSAVPPIRHVLIQLMTVTRLRIEGFTGAACGDPSTWTFTSNAREFAR